MRRRPSGGKFCAELSAAIENVRLQESLKNIFKRDGQPAHSLEFVFASECTDHSYSVLLQIAGVEDDSDRIEAVWIGLPRPLAGLLNPKGR